MYKTSLIVLCIQCIQAVLVLSDMRGRPTRGLSMLRMGKRNLGFLRMGRSYLPPLVPPSYDLPGDDINERQLIGAPRMGKDLEDYDVPRYQSARAPPLPRLGIYDEEYLNEIRRQLASNPEELYNNVAHTDRYIGRQKRSTDTISKLTEETAETPASSDSETVNKEKRALPRFGMREVETNNNPFPRLGLYERETPFPRLGLYERATFPRLGVREEDENERSVPMMPRLGLRDSDLLNEVEAEERALPRYGLRNAEEEKRAMSMLRMGKREEETPNEEKRKMSMLRMGKRKMSMLRMGKRGGMSMLRMGRSQPVETPEEKRAMSMLRMGRSSPDTTDDTYSDEQKRAMSMLRMGKRKMSMLRMGRSYSDSDKRAMSMLRMGRGMSMLRMGRSSPEMNNQNELTSEEEQKRAMSMLRMGRGMSMLRMGRSADKEEMKVTDDKRAMSMLRMGKKDDDKSQS